jgi:hypothetical protein
MKVALSEPRFLNWRYGGGQSLEPPTAPDDPNRSPFEYGRTEVGSDEEAELVGLGGGKYAIRSPNGRSWLSIQPDGRLEERDATGYPGPWEEFIVEGNVISSAAWPDLPKWVLQ